MNQPLYFLADESMEKRIVEAVRIHYDVSFVEEMMKGSKDEQVLQKAEEQKRILLTADKDFGDLVYYRHQAHAGVVLCRLHGLPVTEKTARTIAVFEQYGENLLDSFTVIAPDNLRIRKM